MKAVPSEQTALPSESYEKDWTMAKTNDQEGIHSIHIYPARMVPEVVRDLIKLYGREGEPLGDLYVGSGTVAVEALKQGYDVVCSDINPLAELLTRAKTTYINPTRLEDALSKMSQAYDLAKVSPEEVAEVNVAIPHLDYWFKPKVIEGLIKLRREVFAIKDKEVRNFFKVCFSFTVRKASNIRTREFKLYRRSEESLKAYAPNVLKIFVSVASKAILGMPSIKTITKKPTILSEDARRTSLKSASLGTILTSPPYGDSTTTVAYGQFAKYPLLWLKYDLEKVKEIDKVSLGGKTSGDGEATDVLSKSASLREVAAKVKERDEKRSEVLTRFFRDFDDGLKEMRRVLKDERKCVIVIGNRTMRGVKIPTVQITRELAEKGWTIEGKAKKFECLDIKERRIYQKRMPYVGAPQGRTGKWEPCDLIMNEAIIVLKSI
jgi:adenine-specific DNA methylase